jgi:hypothetical protein
VPVKFKAGQRRTLRRGLCLHAHERTARERLDCEVAERKALAELAKYLLGVAVLMRGRAVEESWEGDALRSVLACDVRGFEIRGVPPVERIL